MSWSVAVDMPIFWLLLWISGFRKLMADKVKLYYIAQNCGKTVGPTHGAYMEYHRDAKFKKSTIVIPDMLKGTLFECSVIIKGMWPTNNVTKHISLFWRTFTIRDPDVDLFGNQESDCGRAYVSFYGWSKDTTFEKQTICGGDARKTDFEWEGEAVTLKFRVDYRNSSTSVSDSGEYLYPKVFFRLDFTSFDYACNDSIKGEVMKCNDSKRCLDDSLRCDARYSKNCHSYKYPLDASDTGWRYPAQCSDPPPTPKPTLRPYEKLTKSANTFLVDYLPVVLPVCLLVGLALTIYCCWKPGFFIWRLGRLRNTRCCQGQSRRKGFCGCFSGYPQDSPRNKNNECSNSSIVGIESLVQLKKELSDIDTDQTKFRETWEKIKSHDGVHLREHR